MHGRLRVLIRSALCLLLFTAAAGISATTWASTGLRHALVIGNNDYATLPDLNNASRDARDIAAKLKPVLTGSIPRPGAHEVRRLIKPETQR